LRTVVVGKGTAAEAACMALEQLGASPAGVAAEDPALRAARTLVVLCVDGAHELEAAEAAIRGWGVRTVVVALTADVRPVAVSRLLTAGAADWIAWPMDPELLRLRLGALLAQGGSDLIFQIGLDAISIIDRETQLFVDVNGAWERQYGYSRDEAVGLLGPKDVTAEPSATQAALAQVMSGGSVCRHLRWHRSRAGAVFPVEIHAGPHTLRGRQVVVAMIRDVSERVRLETQLRQADRMASVGALAAGVAHEINNPLSFVIANLEHLARSLQGGPGAPDVAALGKVVEEAQEGARRVRQIVRDLKTFSRPDEETLGVVDVAAAVQTSLRLLANPLVHRAQLHRELSAGLRARANEARLGQVFVNLISNALDALPHRPAEQNQVRVEVRRGAPGEVVVSFSDNGQGIPAELHSRIFDPFFTTKPVGEGTGLGLSICQGIVTSFGGRIEVQSAPGQGSTFRVVLPEALEDEVPGPARHASPAPFAPREAPMRVLLVDDERNLGRALERAVEPEVRLDFVTDAHEGLARIARGEKYDAVVCDLMMPTMSGIEFYEALRERDPALAASTGFITGGTFTQPAREFAARMAGRVIEKPFLAADLIGLLQRLTRGHAGG
jgi:PAS domain S-box-containing protein